MHPRKKYLLAGAGAPTVERGHGFGAQWSHRLRGESDQKSLLRLWSRTNPASVTVRIAAASAPTGQREMGKVG